MPFRVAQKTLERLEWSQVLARLRDECRTPKARLWLRAHEDAEAPDDEGVPDERATSQTLEHDPFEPSLAGAQEKLAETTEARSLLDTEQIPPLGGAMDLDASLQRVARDGTLGAQELRSVQSTLSTIHATGRYLVGRRETAPRLATLADTIETLPDLERDIERCIDPSGEVSDRASRALARARAEVSRLGDRLQKRLSRYLHDANVSPHLTDSFVTVRNDRYVLPVRAESRGRVKGIVHDASNSGTTLFIEPQEAVELNNSLKQAELEVTRECQRVLRVLSEQVAAARPALETALLTLTRIDLAFARGRLSQQMNGCEPVMGRDGVFEFLQLRHPLLPPDEAVPNDLRLGGDYTVLVLSGPNAGGKTVAMKAVALAALFARAGLHVPAAPGARVDLVDAILADIGDEQDIRESLSTFSAHMVNLAEIVREASPHTLAVLDEIGVGTDPGEGAALAQAVLETLADAGTRVITTTHYNLLKEMAAIDPRFCNASVEFDHETLAPTYRLHVGTPGASSATAVAARMGMPTDLLARANALLEHDDRQLDRMLSELAASRAALETEQREVGLLRAESEATRDEYRGRLERLQERRDKLFHSMRDDLDRAFKQAHDEIAGVIRNLQRGADGGDASTSAGAREAARARAKLQELEKESNAREETARPRTRVPRHAAVDWRRIKPGDAVIVPGGGRAVLESLPDRRGRVSVLAASARLVVPADRIQLPRDSDSAAAPRAARSGGRKPRERVTVESTQPTEDLVGGGTLHCDLRGMRVEEALDRVAEILDDAAAGGSDSVEFIHGLGTGALRKAVRGFLDGSSYVARYEPGGSEAGGDGVTLASLRRGAPSPR